MRRIYNKDLRASQPSILTALLREAELDPSWLVAYAADSGAKQRAAAFIGVPVGVWKTAFLAMLMGAGVPSLAQVVSGVRGRGKAVEAIRDAVGDEAFGDTYSRFLAHTEPLRAVLAEWHTWLADVYLPEHAVRNNADGKHYLTNEVGAKMAVEDLAEGGEAWQLKARLAAFLLQGREVAFIHTLAASGERYGFEVLSHEHDGLVVLGEVPDEAVAAAAEAARMPLDLVHFDDKAFV